MKQMVKGAISAIVGLCVSSVIFLLIIRPALFPENHYPKHVMVDVSGAEDMSFNGVIGTRYGKQDVIFDAVPKQYTYKLRRRTDIFSGYLSHVAFVELDGSLNKTDFLYVKIYVDGKLIEDKVGMGDHRLVVFEYP